MRNPLVTLKIECTSSQILSRWLCACYALLYAFLLLGAWAVWFKLLITLGALLVWCVHRQRARDVNTSFTLLFNQGWSPFPWRVLSESAVQFNQSNDVMKLSLQGRSRVLGPLVLLYFKDDQGHSHRYVLMADSMSAQDWSLLRRWMILRPRVLLGDSAPSVQ